MPASIALRTCGRSSRTSIRSGPSSIFTVSFGGSTATSFLVVMSQRWITGRIRRLGCPGPWSTLLVATTTWSAVSSAMVPPVLVLRS